MKRFFQNVSSFGLALILVFSLVATIGVAFFQQTLLNESTYTQAILANKVATRVHETIEDNMDYLMVVNNIPQTVVDGIISEAEVSVVLNQTVADVLNFLKGTTPEIKPINFTLYQQRIEKNINAYVATQETVLSQQQLRDIAALKVTLLQIISGEVQLLDFAELSQSSIAQLVVKLAQFFNDPKVLAALVLINSLFMLPFLAIWRRRRARRYAWISYPLLTVGTLAVVIGAGGYLSGFYYDLAVQITYIADTVAQVIQTYLSIFIWYGVFLLALGISSMAMYWRHLFKRYLGKNKNRRTRRSA
ncbi:MAG: hypothetical protein ACRDCC_08130 [Culicoidibacterales bacterium]